MLAFPCKLIEPEMSAEPEYGNGGIEPPPPPLALSTVINSASSISFKSIGCVLLARNIKTARKVASSVKLGSTTNGSANAPATAAAREPYIVCPGCILTVFVAPK